mgnify:CR=1 FL=1
MNTLKRILKNRNTYSWIALLLLVLGEYFALRGIREDWFIWGPWIQCIIVLAVALIFIGHYFKHIFSLRSVILTKLLANAIAPQRLGTIYLFFFVIHIGWLTNGVMSLFMPKENLYDVLTSITVCAMGMVLLIIFFPNGSIDMINSPQKVFVSGISPFPEKKIDPKTGDPEKPIIYSKFNLIPLIKILEVVAPEISKLSVKVWNDPQEVAKIQQCKLLIIKTNYYDSKLPSTPYLDDTKGVELNDDTLTDELDEFCISSDNPTDDRIRLLIKKTASREFESYPNMKEWIKNKLIIEFTESVDYDDYEKCFRAASNAMKKLDLKEHLFYFNLTPGTATIKLILTLLSISAKHRLFYYSQGKAPKLVDVDKSLLPLQNLLSQALETFETSTQS